MKKNLITILSLLVILAFIGYIVFDSVKPSQAAKNEPVTVKSQEIPDAWEISNVFTVSEGSLKAVTVTPNGEIYLGGTSFLSCYDKDLKLLWKKKTKSPVTSLSNYGDTVYASTANMIYVLNFAGRILSEWGPFEDSSLITSLSSNRKYVAVADAGNKIVFILDKGGEVKKMIGQNRNEFVIPSPYFDVALDNEDNLFVANTGKHRIETRTIDGVVKSYFGEAGTAPGLFCGCCAPPHFAIIPDGFVTAEKGINRIKILNKKGEFVEFVNSKNNFVKSVPLDVASSDGKIIYAANPADSRLYIFKRK